ncbi:MAG: hypothetical protein V3S24_07185, partial [Candidatus Tectomicrobia bacterium]
PGGRACGLCFPLSSLYIWPYTNNHVTSRKVALEYLRATTLTNRVSFYLETINNIKSKVRFDEIP